MPPDRNGAGGGESSQIYLITENAEPFILCESRVAADNRQVFGDCLRYKHAIERVAVILFSEGVGTVHPDAEI
jgi:hypothetical protein